MGSVVVVRASDYRPEGLGSMPLNTFRVHTEYVLVKSVGPKVLWAEPRVQGVYTRAFGDGPRNFEPWSGSPNRTHYNSIWAMGSVVVVRASDYRPEGLATRGLLATDHVILNHGVESRIEPITTLFGHGKRSGGYCIGLQTGRPGYTRAFGDGPRNFEPWSSDMDDTRAGTSLS
ncbi:hypothetical protein TNCV_3463951 [Trichonephila clavipes]|nr:hypothetical protein TNCV_3463951 [Trichonephila clavipes]